MPSSDDCLPPNRFNCFRATSSISPNRRDREHPSRCAKIDLTVSGDISVACEVGDRAFASKA